MNDGSDWMNHKFVTQKTSKCITKIRNALIRKVDCKGNIAAHF